jgi:hypothetical protein
MADSKITALTSIGTSTDPANDPLVLVDVSDTSMAATGTTKKVTLNQLLATSPTATLASATITGDLTVDTSTLKVDSANNRVGIGTATPQQTLDVSGTINSIQARFGNVNGRGLTIGTALVAGVNEAGSVFNALGSGSGAHIFQVDSVEQMRLNSTGLGVGGSPATKIFANVTPPGAGQDGMRVTDGTRLIQMSISGSTYSYLGIGANQNVIYASGNPLSILSDSQNLRIGTGTNAYILLDTSGNVGVGVTPSATDSTYYQALEITRVGQGLTGAKTALTSSPNSWLSNNSYATYSAGIVWKYAVSQPAAQYRLVDASHQWLIAASGTAGNAITFTQAMTLTAGGDLLVGQTTAGLDANGGIWVRSASSAFGSSVIINHRTAVGTGNSYAEFTHNGVVIGSISQNGTTGVLYNITSDYRLKEAVQPITDGLSRINALKPSIYKWKSDGSAGEGFLAHELAEVVPLAVSGEKDAVNEDGSIKSQGIDMSRIVPILVAAIKELTARVEALEA